jgi:hypothetical protein
MRQSSDSFPIIVALTAAVLMFFGQNVYERVAADWIIGELTPWIDPPAAMLIERISMVVLSGLISLGLLIGVYRYAWREFSRQADLAGLRAKQRPAWEDQPGVERDVWLYDAVCRIFLGRWDKIPIRGGKLALDGAEFPVLHDLVAHQIRQLACDGRLPIWGKRRGFWALWELTPPEYWKQHQIDYESFLQADPRMIHALPCDLRLATPMRELMTSKASVDLFCDSVAL